MKYFVKVLFGLVALVLLIGASFHFGMVYGIKKVSDNTEIFCKDCCWQTEYFYTCTKDKENLFKMVQ